jgi:hypothetical protein
MTALDQTDIVKRANEIALEPDVYFMEDIIASLCISKPSFYKYIPVDSNDFNDIKEKIEFNRTTTKKKMRKRWKEEDAPPVLQIALYKLIGDDNESDRINSQQTKITGPDNQPIQITIVK